MEKDVYNKSKLAFHKNKLESLSTGEVTAPVYIRIKPINRCDHRCFYCSYNPDNKCPVSETIDYNAILPREKMLEILDDFKDMRVSDTKGIGVMAVTYSGGGEPLIYPHISEAMKKTLENRIELSIITNGQKLNGERAEILTQAEWVRISASESDAKTFSETRKRPESWFYELGNNIKNFARIKKPECELGINFVVQDKNADKLYESVKYFKELGVNHIKITPCWFPNFLEYHKDIRKKAEEQIAKARQNFEEDGFTVYDTYKNDFELTGIDKRLYSKCYVMQIIPVIGADSIVYFCHDKTNAKNGILGSIKNKSFKELWFSNKVKEIFKNFNPKKECRHHCTYDRVNLNAIEMLNNLDILDEYKPSDYKHKNFI